ncbi:hypothetical protein [Methylobacterium sp. P1-11]|uniref:hypothetical protein n=1 Tax=Methylobacterium sp. P1-11 TaxID=2024616 RepID=UPI0011EBA2CC|nr:hypothetical protein [Methylobacterium sp. P1-11]
MILFDPGLIGGWFVVRWWLSADRRYLSEINPEDAGSPCRAPTGCPCALSAPGIDRSSTQQPHLREKLKPVLFGCTTMVLRFSLGS